MKLRLTIALVLCCSLAGFVWIRSSRPHAPARIEAGSDAGIAPSGFHLYDNQALPADIEVLKDIEFGHGGAKVLRLNIVRQKLQDGTPKPVVVYIPGGGWLRSDKEVALGRLAALAQHGYIGVSIQFRTSEEGLFPAQIEDCKCAIRFLRAKAREYNIDPDHIGVWGSSAGGHLGALLGLTPNNSELEGAGGWGEFSSRVQAVSAWYPPTDFRGMDLPNEHPISRLLGGNPKSRPQQAAMASPVAQVRAGVVPFFLVHGEKDPAVPITESRALVQALERVGVEVTLLALPEAGHGFITSVEAEKMMKFFDRHLRPGSGAVAH